MAHPGIELVRSFLTDSGVAAGSIVDMRNAMAELAASVSPPDGVTVRTGELAGRPAEWLSPDGGAEDRTVLYLHGGGYCAGTLGTHRVLAGRLALATGTRVVTLDYRLAPEHPFPAALDDAVAAFDALCAGGLAPDRCAIAGDSAGGGLTVATLLALRGAGRPLPAAAACLSPWTDLTQTSGAYERLAGADPMVSKRGLDEMASAYLGETDPRTELASPLFADRLGGLPPVRIDVGSAEVLLDDATALAERIRTDGGEVELVVWPEMIHVFQAFPGDLLPEADESVAAIGAFLAEHLGIGKVTPA